MKIALIAHDRKKENLIEFSIAYQHILAEHELFATGTTGQLISEATGLEITKFKIGPACIAQMTTNIFLKASSRT